MVIAQTELSLVEENLVSLLRRGKAEAKPSKQIIAELQSLGIDLGGDPVRELRNIMHSLRCKGYPICASNDAIAGYFLAETPDELFDYIQRELDRIREQAKPIAVLRRVYRQWVNEKVQQRLSIVSEEGRAFLRSLVLDEELGKLRDEDQLKRFAQKFYFRVVMAKINEMQVWLNTDIAMRWLKEHGITESSVVDFIKSLMRGR